MIMDLQRKTLKKILFLMTDKKLSPLWIIHFKQDDRHSGDSFPKVCIELFKKQSHKNMTMSSPYLTFEWDKVDKADKNCHCIFYFLCLF